MKKVTINDIQKAKNSEPLVMITAYDALFTKLFDPYVDMILVGDSLNMSFFGASDTLSATFEQMIYHTKAVCNGRKRAFVVFDMPFGSYTTKDEALKNAISVYKETDADAVKLEGDASKAEVVKHLVQNGIAVIGHIGLLPQFVRSQGGYKVQRDETKLLHDAKAMEEAGAFCLIVEGVEATIAAKITKSISIPVIGIGAGNATDGQVLVWSDLLGFFEERNQKVRE